MLFDIYSYRYLLWYHSYYGYSSYGCIRGIGVPAALTAGAIASGAILGDKVSPLSDSTNLTAAMTGTKLFDHVRSMLYVTIPAAFISLGLYWVVGNRYISGEINMETVNSILQTLSSNFNLSPLTLVPPLLVVLLSIRKVPAVMALMISFLTASFFAILTQGATISSILAVSSGGYVANTGLEIVDKLLTHGGINSMMNTVAIIMAGTAMGGILENCGVLDTILEALLHYIKTPGA